MVCKGRKVHLGCAYEFTEQLTCFGCVIAEGKQLSIVDSGGVVALQYQTALSHRFVGNVPIYLLKMRGLDLVGRLYVWLGLYLCFIFIVICTRFWLTIYVALIMKFTCCNY